VVWSLFSGLTAFADGFWQLFFCRVMVGVGEATLGPAAISLLADYFPPVKRATVTSIYSMGIAIGAGLAALLGGSLSQFGWRTVFLVVGFPGVLFGILVYFLREPPRTVAAATDSNYTSTDWKRLLTNRTFVVLCLGYSLLGLATNSLSIWGATFYARVHQIDVPTIGFWAGVLTLVAGIPATLFGGAIADRFRRRQAGGRMLYGALLALISVPFWLVVIYTENVPLIFIASLVLLAAALGWVGAAAADATEIAGVHLRGLSIGILFFGVNISAYLIGSNLIGLLNDRLGVATNPAVMRYGLLVCPITCLLSGLILLAGSRMRNREI
jgi:MFS family permease